MSETLLDLQDLTCPLPVLKANRALRGMPPGARLRVLISDRASVGDFRQYCAESGHVLVALGEESGVFSITLRRA